MGSEMCIRDSYGVDIELVPVEDAGGPLTARALKDGTVQVADLYTADPTIAKEGFVILEDPEGLILPQNVIPIVSEKVDATAAAAIEAVNAKLTVAELQALNARSVDEQARSADIATDWHVRTAAGLGIPVFAATQETHAGMRGAGVPVAGTLDDLLTQADVVVDTTPKKVAVSRLRLLGRPVMRA